MKLKLISDFTDYWDYMMDSEGEIFRRVTTDGLNRHELLEYLQKLEFTVPCYGSVKELSAILKPQDRIVLHHDIWAHRGEGKELSTITEAILKYPDTLATQFIQFNVPGTPPEVKGLSWRYLQVGTESFWLEYTSTEDWRSNCGEGDIKLSFRDKTELFSNHQYEDLLKFKFPLFAVDFVPDGDTLYAVDFNIAPGTAPIKQLMTPREVVDAIKKAYSILKEETETPI